MFDSTHIRHIRSPRLASALVAVAVAVLCLGAPTAQAADWDFGLRGGLYMDEPDPFVGIEGLTRIGGSSWFFNPNAELVLVDNGDLATLNADFHYDFDVDSSIYLWAGGGLALVLQDRDLPPGADDDDTDIGANLLFGVGFKTSGRWRPYVQAKALIADQDQAVLAVGVRF